MLRKTISCPALIAYDSFIQSSTANTTTLSSNIQEFDRSKALRKLVSCPYLITYDPYFRFYYVNRPTTLRGDAEEFVPAGNASLHKILNGNGEDVSPVNQPVTESPTLEDDAESYSPTSQAAYITPSLDSSASSFTLAENMPVYGSTKAEHLINIHGNDIRKWSASARTELAPFNTTTLEIHSQSKIHTIPVPQLAFLVTSPRARARLAENPQTRRFVITSPKLTIRAVRAIAAWLREICVNDEVHDIVVPDNTVSWQNALELRMSAITLDMESYVRHIEHQYTRSMIGKEINFAEVQIVVNTACNEDDSIMIALASSLSYLVQYHKLSGDQEVQLVTQLARPEYASLLRAVRRKMG
jgi:hypothetical protein